MNILQFSDKLSQINYQYFSILKPFIHFEVINLLVKQIILYDEKCIIIMC